MHGSRLAPAFRDAVVPDHRRGEADQLLGEGGVGDDLLVTGHRGREDRLSDREPIGRDRLPAEDRSVLEREEPGHAAYTSRPAATVARTRPFTVAPSSHELTERERNACSSMR